MLKWSHLDIGSINVRVDSNEEYLGTKDNWVYNPLFIDVQVDCGTILMWCLMQWCRIKCLRSGVLLVELNTCIWTGKPHTVLTWYIPSTKIFVELSHTKGKGSSGKLPLTPRPQRERLLERYFFAWPSSLSAGSPCHHRATHPQSVFSIGPC